VPKQATKQQPPKTKLAAWRIRRGATQPDMVKDTGIPISTYQRYEAGDYIDPPYRALMNCAIVLEVDINELIEDKFRRWTAFDVKQPPRTPRWKARPGQ
jgi:transcriptional regulator with XRE-family HTH domain